MKCRVSQGHAETLFRWWRKCWYQCMTNLFRITDAKFYIIWLSFIGDIKKTFGCILGPLGRGRGWPVRRSMPVSTLLRCQIWSFQVKVYVRRSAGKKWAPRVPPFKVTQGHWKRHGSISYLWLMLVINGNHWSSMYRFRDKRRFPSKIAIFPLRLYRPHLEFCNGGRAEKARTMPRPDGEKWLNKHPFWYNSTTWQKHTDRPTDWQTELMKHHRTLHVMHADPR